MLTTTDPSVLPGIEDSRFSSVLITALQEYQRDNKIPSNFPLTLWAIQAERYLNYWAWFRGDILNDTIGTTQKGQPIFRYPLRINPVRDFARKHAALLFGEVPDTPSPLVRMKVTPKVIYGEDPDDTIKKTAGFLEACIGEIWTSSKGRSIQLENGLIGQFLGGCVFKLRYDPRDTTHIIPIRVQAIYPDFCLPIWDKDDYFNLLEMWEVYRVPMRTIVEQYGAHVLEGSTEMSGTITAQAAGPQYALWVEHWTQDTHSIWINGIPLKLSADESYDHAENPFGFVPYVYIPRLREGNFYGSSFIPDIEGMVLEYNARLADHGDAIHMAVQRKLLGRNITQVRIRDLDEYSKYIDLGNQVPGTKEPPDLFPLDPPDISPEYLKFTESIWVQMLRDVGLGPIAYGEDEGSQRSALTLAFRMFPSTALGKMQRTFWTDGLIQLAKYMLRMMAYHNIKVGSKSVPADFERYFDIAPDWLPMIPRDREAQVNEVILRGQEHMISPQHAMDVFGDVEDKEREMREIKEWVEFIAKTEAAQSKGAESDIETPVASTGLNKD